MRWIKLCRPKKFTLIFVFVVLLLLYYNVFQKRHHEIMYQNLYGNESISDRFLVFSKKCKIPYISPFHPEVMAIYKIPKFKTCSDVPDLITVNYNTARKAYSLHINMEVLPQIMPEVFNVSCFYYEISRAENDLESSIGNGTYFEQDEELPRHLIGIIVQCSDTFNLSHIIQKDAFSLVQCAEENRYYDNDNENVKPSVIILGIDAMSRMNFYRTMRKTAQFVDQKGWYEMQGYNKIGDNTLPNLMTILTGRTPEQWQPVCDVEKVGCLDYLPFIWDHFKKAGYVTAYGEDIGGIDTFHYDLKGFVRPPVDYYLRTFIVGIEGMLSHVIHYSFNYCTGRRLSFSYVYDFCLQFVQRFVDELEKPAFGLFWTNSFTHDAFEGGATLDDIFVDYLRQFEEHRLFERSIVILLSDHGQRYGPLVTLSSGFYEERLPILYIYLPPWYRKKYPAIPKALNVNQRRLSSPADLHLTFKHLLNQIRPRQYFLKDMTFPNSQSLLMPLPKDRSCSEAGIPEHWCSCYAYKVIPIQGFLNFVAKKIIMDINRAYQSLPCVPLHLTYILKAEKQIHYDNIGNEMNSSVTGFTSYRLLFKTRPNGALYQATIRCNEDLTTVETRLEHISRLNAYKNQSHCVLNKNAKKFCYCIEQTKTKRHKKKKK